MEVEKICTNKECVSFPNTYETDRYICWYCGCSLRKVNEDTQNGEKLYGR